MRNPGDHAETASSTLRLDSQSPLTADAAKMNRVVFLLGLSVFINYIDRSNLSIAAPLL